jgi:hypothetical protein
MIRDHINCISKLNFMHSGALSYFVIDNIYLSSLVDYYFYRRLVLQRIYIVLHYSLICFYMLMIQISFKGFSRTKIEN